MTVDSSTVTCATRVCTVYAIPNLKVLISLDLRPVCFNLVQTSMYTLDPAPTDSGYEKSGRVVQNWNFLTNSINFEAEL